jgi:phosphoglycolate phosphatase-like HAD superfamily hydrolase/ADP-ribose pyrophosphatase YjhB (NUDIX family)
MIRNVIFDWSGTLVDDLPAVWKATNYVFRQAGRPELSLEQFRAEFCLPFTGFYERHLGKVSWPELEGWFHEQFQQVQESVVALPHAREFLHFCRERGVRALVLTTVRQDHYERQAGALGFGQYIDRAYVGVWDKRTKIHELLAENRCEPGETLYVGDMQHDIETARHGGVFACAVLTGYNSLGQLRASKPDLVVEHLGELREILERHGMRMRLDGAPGGAEARPVATVGALIYDAAGRVLMIRTHKWSNLWGIPGGKIKFGETALAALQREIEEETALRIDQVKFVLAQDCIHSPEFYRDAHFVLLNYTCLCVGEPHVKLNEEAVEYRWVAVAEAMKMKLNQPTRALLEAVAAA